VAARNWPYVEELARYVLGRDPSNKWALNNRVQALIRLERPREAQDVAADLLERYPNSENSYVKLASAYEAQGLHETAHDVLDEGLRVAPDSPLLIYLWLLEGFEAGLPSICAGEIQTVLARHPGTWQILVLRSRCEVRAGRYDEALRTLEEAVGNGFRKIEPLGELEEFRELAGRPEFQRLVADSQERESERARDGDTKP
jgi:tetratricopeptide (TPR) repeat protein